MQQKTILGGIIVTVFIACSFAIWKTTSISNPNTSPVANDQTTEQNTQTETHGSISSISKNPQVLKVIANGITYSVAIASSTQVIRDVGGTVGGTFTFDSLKVGDMVVIVGTIDASNSITPTFVEQLNSQGIN